VDDYDRLVVKIHSADKPPDLRWGDYVSISLDKMNWIACKLEPAGETGVGKIYLNAHLRGLLNRVALGVPLARLEAPCQLYMKKAASWRESFYVMNYHPDSAVRARMRWKIYGTSIAVIAAVAVILALAASSLGLTGS